MPRDLAFDVLTTTFQSRKPFDEAFKQHPNVTNLEPRDRGFAFNMIVTTLRRLGQIDDIITQCLDSPLPPKANKAKTILRLGICQLLFLETPPHAAVSTSVDLAEAYNQGPYKKLINAILRRVSREHQKLLGQQDTAKLNTPEWLWAAWEGAYSEPIARKIAAAHLTPPPLDISTKGKIEDWAEKLDGVLLPTGSIRLTSPSNIADLPGFEAGEWWVQDTAASLPAKLFGRDLNGQKIADICAAPGGKTAQLLAAGAEVTALDRSENRLQTLRQNLERLGLSAHVICADAATWQPDELLDGVLLDAPCSATGTMRRHPDVAFLKRPEDIAKAHQAQLRLLQAAAEMIKPGGCIVYATCSLQAEEGPNVIKAFLAAQPNFKRHKIEAHEIGDQTEMITERGDLRTLPCHLSEEGGLDGFFAARLTKS